MKRFAVAFFVIALLLSNLAAKAASATFTTRRGEIFQLLLDGRPVNGPGSALVRIDRLPAGPHNVEFRVPARRGYLTFCSKIFLERGFETNYVLVLPGYNPNFMLKKVSVVPLRRPVCNTCPPPHGGYQANDVYDDYDYPAPQGNSNYNQGNGNYNGNNYNNGGSNYNQNGSYNNNFNNGSYGNNSNSNYNPAPNNSQNVLSQNDVNLLLESMSRKSFENSKLEIAKQALASSYIQAEDLKRIVKAFGFENSRLEFAKYAYPKVYDQQNFYRVYDAFEFESSISEMQRWLKQ